MYTIRVEATRPVMRIELSQRLTAEEALRAISQGFALAEAGHIRGVLCDLRALDRAPGQLLVIAAALASRYQPGLRIAFLADERQMPLTRRVVRFSGIREGLTCITDAAEAEAWVAPPVVATTPRISGTTRRHAEDMLRPAAAVDRRRAVSRVKEAGPAA